MRPLGRGAMGQVYQALDRVLGRKVAVKFIAHASPSEAVRERFLVEARAIARVQHPNVVSIYRVGVVDGRPYLVSEFVHGQSLDKMRLPMPWRRALDIAVQLSSGLAAAHARGVLHRDIKPAKRTPVWNAPQLVPGPSANLRTNNPLRRAASCIRRSSTGQPLAALGSASHLSRVNRAILAEDRCRRSR